MQSGEDDEVEEEVEDAYEEDEEEDEADAEAGGADTDAGGADATDGDDADAGAGDDVCVMVIEFHANRLSTCTPATHQTDMRTTGRTHLLK